jgi:hypothetical protein
MTLRYTTRPLSDRTWLRPDSARKRAQFDATWSKTLQQLEREIEWLKGRDVVIEVDVREQDIRLDGMLRATARAETPAVVVAFESAKHGPMLYRADAYAHSWSNRPGWQENVRAIALTLEALRAVDRYGATETGQQYTGFKAIGGGSAIATEPPTMTSAVATELIRSYAPAGVPLDKAWRHAIKATHPDTNGGDATAWHRVEVAGRVLGLVK